MFARRSLTLLRPPLLAAVAAVAAFACAPEPTAVDEEPEIVEVAADEVAPPPASDPLPLRAHVFECADGTRVVAEFGADHRVALTLSDRELSLPQVRSGSGARYSDGEVVFWDTGDTALLGFGGEDGPLADCVKDRRSSVVESARRDGARLWASGNEPGWTLRIYRDRILLLTDYGATRIQAPTLDPERSSGATVYRTTSNDHDLTVTVRNRPCADDMSGERFSRSVEIVVDGSSLRGCGEPLR